MRTRAPQRGVAIVLAMGVVALAALAAMAMMVSESTWARQVELTDAHAQARRLSQAGLDWARAVLSDDRRASSVDHLGEAWALQLPPIPVEDGSLAGHLEDEQGKFNLNNLLKDGQIDLAQLGHFRRLLAILALPPTLADALADWIDADGAPQPQVGAEDAYYLSLKPGYLTANRPLSDLGELALVRGFDDNVRRRLRPFVTALPRSTPVNVNTAPPEVIAAIIDKLGLDDARAVVAMRQRTYFRGNPDFFSQLPRGLNAPNEEVSVSSDYFLVTMAVTIGDTEARGSALLDRASAGWPATVWRKYP